MLPSEKRDYTVVKKLLGLIISYLEYVIGWIRIAELADLGVTRAAKDKQCH